MLTGTTARADLVRACVLAGSALLCALLLSGLVQSGAQSAGADQSATSSHADRIRRALFNEDLEEARGLLKRGGLSEAEHEALTQLCDELELAAICDQAEERWQAGDARAALAIVKEGLTRTPTAQRAGERARALQALLEVSQNLAGADHRGFLRELRQIREQALAERQQVDDLLRQAPAEARALMQKARDEALRAQDDADRGRISSSHQRYATAREHARKGFATAARVELLMQPDEYQKLLAELRGVEESCFFDASLAIARMHFFQKNDSQCRVWIARAQTFKPTDRSVLDMQSKLSERVIIR